MSLIPIDGVELQRLQECSRIVEMIEVLCAEPFTAITFHAHDDSIQGRERLIVIKGARPALEPCDGEDLEPYDAQYYGESFGACLEQAVAAETARE